MTETEAWAEIHRAVGRLEASVTNLQDRQERHLKLFLELDRKVDGLVAASAAAGGERRAQQRSSARIAAVAGGLVSGAVSLALAFWRGR